MHIIFSSSEKPVLEQIQLPEGTTLIEQEDDPSEYSFSKNLYRYIVRNGEMEVDVDFIDNDADFATEEDRKKFMDRISKEDVIKFFVVDHPNEDDLKIPQREYNAYSDKWHDFFDNFMSGGIVDISPEGEEWSRFTGRFSLVARKGWDRDIVKLEMKELLAAVHAAYPDLTEYDFDILEKDCSYHGSWGLRIKDFDLSQCELGIIRYGHYSVKQEGQIDKVLDYIEENLADDSF